MPSPPPDTAPESSQRLDKWLWVARFFKTRNLAARAVTGGKVQVDGERAKPARRIRKGERLTIRRGVSEREVVVQGLARQRRPAREAALLYAESAGSPSRRSSGQERRRAIEAWRRGGPGRPGKRDRRETERLGGGPRQPSLPASPIHHGLHVPGAGSGTHREARCAIIDSSRPGRRSIHLLRSLLAFIRPFVSICLLRLRPQDLPASNLLLALAILTYVVITTVAHSALLPPADALLSGIVDSVLLCTLTLSLLYVCRRRGRAVQTLTALVGAGAVTTMVAIPFLSWRVSIMQAGGPAGVEMVGIVVIVVWNLVVIAHVLRHALSISYLGGAVVAIVMYLLSSQILGALVEGRISI